MNKNYITFIINFNKVLKNFNIFIISRKFNEKMIGNININWDYIGREKLNSNFIVKYHGNIKDIYLYDDYSEDFIKNYIFKYDIIIDYDSKLRKYSDDFIIFWMNLDTKMGCYCIGNSLLNNHYNYDNEIIKKLIKKLIEKSFYYLAIDIMKIYPFDYNFYYEYFLNEARIYRDNIDLNLSKFTLDNLKDIISKIDFKNDFNNNIFQENLINLLHKIIRKINIPTDLRKYLILNRFNSDDHEFDICFCLHQYQTLTFSEIKLLKKEMLNPKREYSRKIINERLSLYKGIKNKND